MPAVVIPKRAPCQGLVDMLVPNLHLRGYHRYETRHKTIKVNIERACVLTSNRELAFED